MTGCGGPGGRATPGGGLPPPKTHTQTRSPSPSASSIRKNAAAASCETSSPSRLKTLCRSGSSIVPDPSASSLRKMSTIISLAPSSSWNTASTGDSGGSAAVPAFRRIPAASWAPSRWPGCPAAPSPSVDGRTSSQIGYSPTQSTWR